MRIHVLGVCGTFMAGLALLARERGIDVIGSDLNTYPPMSTQLAAEGIEVVNGYHPESMADESLDCVVVGNAMTRGNPAVEALLNGHLRYSSGPQWLAENVLAGTWTLAVAGTHGKTTTASMLAWILEYAGLEPGFLIGGIPKNFSVSARLGGGNFFVVEADEYDSAFFDKRSKFVHYRPRTLILNNLEFDHADIFADLAAIETQFHHLVRTIPANGLIVSNGAASSLETVLARGCWTPVESFNGLDNRGWTSQLLADDGSHFAVTRAGQSLGEVEWSQVGQHNVDNGVAAIAAARHAGVPVAVSLSALGEFAGVRRRLELRGVQHDISVYDDFAHHPSAIVATLDAMRRMLVRRTLAGRLIAVVELRSSTMRSGVFDRELGAALQEADRVIICSKRTLQLMHPAGEICADSQSCLDVLLMWAQPGDHVVIMSNGGFDGLHERYLTTLADIAATPRGQR